MITLYGRPDCHLCEEAREAILGMRGEPPSFEFREVDIDGDDSLLATYLERIPVVAVDGRIVSELELDAGRVRQALGRASA